MLILHTRHPPQSLKIQLHGAPSAGPGRGTGRGGKPGAKPGEEGQRGGQRWAPADRQPCLLLSLCPYFQLPRGLGRRQGDRDDAVTCQVSSCLPAWKGAPRQPSTHLTPPLQHPGSSQATRCWRSTGCHCLGGTPIHISAPRRRVPGHLEGTGGEGTAGAAAAMAPGHRRWAVPGASSPSALGCTPSPKSHLLLGPLHAQHPVWVHQPQPPQSWAALTGLGATQVTKGSRNPPLC